MAERRFRRNPAIEAAPLQEESVLFDPVTKKFSLLNRTMAFVWARLAEGSTIDEISAQLCANFRGVTPEQARVDVTRAIDQLVSSGLLQQAETEATA